jgi:hypothetical protein
LLFLALFVLGFRLPFSSFLFLSTDEVEFFLEASDAIFKILELVIVIVVLWERGRVFL